MVAVAATTSSESRMSEKRAGRRLWSRHYHQTLRYDVTEPSVQRALLRVLPEVSFLAAARSCSTKSWARERPPGPRPLRSHKFPRGLPELQGSDLQRVTDFPDETLPDDHVYIGPGHFSHRWPVGDWSNPFHPGRDGTAFETVILYMQWIQGQPSLLEDLYTSPSRENPGLRLSSFSALPW